jgi:hypothetical protein
VAPGKEERAGAHRNGGSMARRCKRCRPAVFNGGGVAPVVVDEGGWVLQLEGDPRVWRRRSIEGKSSSEGRSPEGGTTVMLGWSPARRRGSGGVKPARRTPGRWERRRGARAWTDETNSARGEKNLRLAGDGSVLTGSGGEGARRGGHHMEAERKREREREGPWARRGAARRARAVRCRATVEDGGVGVTRSTWLTGGVGSTVCSIQFSNRIKLISNGFKFAPNFDRSKRCLPLLQKFQIKYGYEEHRIRNNFSYRNFSRFKIKFDLKFEEFSMS